jgi:hypothetical protein
MLMTRERRPAIRTLRGWAINVLNEAGAIRECEDHGWMQDRADPHARERAVDIAREDPPPWGLAAVGRRRNRRSAGFDRRHLPRMPASGLTALFRVQLAFGQAESLKAALSRLFLQPENSPDVP